MSVTSDPKEERAHALALTKLMGHVGSCGNCAQAIREGQKTEVVQAVDLSDPATPLCPRGVALREAAVQARAALPAERLISFYALEGHDLRGDPVEIPAPDAHDCARGVAWLREDPGRARALLDQLVDRAGPLEERTTSVLALREGFLLGFRKISPSRDQAPTDEQREKRKAAAERITALVADRYEKRHGVPPALDVVMSFRKSHDVWIEGSGDLERMAQDAEKFRDQHPKRWATKALLKPKDPLNEMKKIARWICEGLIEGEMQKG